PEAIVVTVGCQEAMLLVVRALHARPEDVLVVASPCYVGITGAARILGVEVAAVDEGPDGFDCERLRDTVLAQRARGRRPRALYPGARVGFAVADQEVVDRAGRSGPLAAELAKIKSMVTVNTSPLSQAVVAGMLLAADGEAARLTARNAAYYGATMRATLDRLE